MPKHSKTTSFKSWKGINNIVGPESTPAEYLKKALNVNIDKYGGISKRKGYTLKDSGDYTSLWTNQNNTICLAVKDNNLVNIDKNYSLTTIKNGVGLDKISFEEVDNIIYFSSISYSGLLDNGLLKSWGIERNYLSPILSKVNGSLPAGTYQVTFTYVREDGIESGTGVASTITLTDNSGISLFIPNHSDPDIIYARIYCSTQDGMILYFSGISNLNSTYTITSQDRLVNPLRTFNLDAPPKGHLVKYYNGRLYIADNNILWYSEKYQYQHFKLDSNYIEFPDIIKEIMPVEDGIWIGSDKLYYLSGNEPTEFRRITKEDINIIPGTSVKISGSYIHMDNVPVGYKWFVSSDLGIFILFNQGMVINLTSENINLESADFGTSLFLQDEGMNQYLSILKTNENPNNSVVGDLIETSIISGRNLSRSNMFISDSITTTIN